MIINSPKAIFTYDGLEPLNLIDSPNSEDVNNYSIYHTFINSISMIYGNQKIDGSIPVFWTKLSSNKKYRIPDPTSTLKQLLPNQSYYVVTISDEVLPLQVPKSLDISNLVDIELNNNTVNESYDLCFKYAKIISTGHHNINLTSASGYSTNIDIVLTGLAPNKTYSYTVDPLYSNWPAKLSSSSGEVQKLGPTSGVISTIFSYYPSGDDYSQSIAYEDVSTDNMFLSKNIFSIMNCNISSNNCDTITDIINIKCNDCLPNFYRDCATISLDSGNIILSGKGNTSTKLNIVYDKLDPSKNYSLSFESLGSNWPCRVDPPFAIIKPDNLYNDSNSNIVYGSGSIEASISFIPRLYAASWSNLDYSLDSFLVGNEFNSNDLYCILKASLSNASSGKCPVSAQSNIIECRDCLPHIPNCIENVVLQFHNSSLEYPTLSSSVRPGAEFSVDMDCCDNDHVLTVDISGACCGDEYAYTFSSSNSLVDISPTSGNIAFGNGTGRISAVYNLNDRPGSSIKFRLIHKETDLKAMDHILVRCPDKIPILPS